MSNRDFSELVTALRPPAPEVPRAQQLEYQRQQIFHSHQPGMVPRGPENDAREFRALEPVDAPALRGGAETCVLDERGGHLRLGRNCPHGLTGFDPNEVLTVDF